MKKGLLTILAIALVALGMSSCATHSKMMNMDNNMVILDSANFEYVKTIKEDASATYVLGFCGGNPEQKAIDRLKASANLQANQALTNYTITKSSRNIFGIVLVKTITVSADIIQFK
jgi:hypothetical protein